MSEEKAPEVPEKNQEKVVDAFRRYYVAEVIDAVRAGDLAVIVDAARLYPALVASLLADPVLLLRSLYGHKKARRAEMRLKDLFYLKRRQSARATEEAKAEREAAEVDPDADEDESRRLLETLQRGAP